MHFAAESHVDRSILSAEEFVLTNVLGTQVMLDVARHRKAKRFLHISTDEVGGDMPPDGWFQEDSPLRPNSPYAASKTAAEHFSLRAASHTFTALTWSLPAPAITTDLISFRKNCCRWPFLNAIDDRPIPVYGDGLQVRDWVHVTDNCRALLAVLEQAGGPVKRII